MWLQNKSGGVLKPGPAYEMRGCNYEPLFLKVEEPLLLTIVTPHKVAAPMAPRQPPFFTVTRACAHPRGGRMDKGWDTHKHTHAGKFKTRCVIQSTLWIWFEKRVKKVNKINTNIRYQGKILVLPSRWRCGYCCHLTHKTIDGWIRRTGVVLSRLFSPGSPTSSFSLKNILKFGISPNSLERRVWWQPVSSSSAAIYPQGVLTQAPARLVEQGNSRYRVLINVLRLWRCNNTIINLHQVVHCLISSRLKPLSQLFLLWSRTIAAFTFQFFFLFFASLPDLFGQLGLFAVLLYLCLLSLFFFICWSKQHAERFLLVTLIMHMFNGSAAHCVSSLVRSARTQS